MAVTTNVQIILEAVDNASKVLKRAQQQVQDSGEKIGQTFKDGAIASAGFLGAVGALGVGMVNVASDFEQNRIAFETMLGSAEKGRKVLTDLSNFAVSTPFELPQLLQSSKSLLAYGIEADNLIPTLKNLGDIAAGVGMDKLPQLTLAFGQVKAATKLTGNEVRQFTEAGVPILDALVEQANKAGGAWVTVGGNAKKTKVDVAELNDKLSIASQRLKEAEGNAKTKASTLMSLRNTVQNYQQSLAKANDTGTQATKVWQKNSVTVSDMKDKISAGEVTFEQVQQALAGMTSEGGKFFNLMEKQSHTFGGVMSNIRDQVTRSLAEIAGIDIQNGGIIREGSMFAVMKTLAERFLSVLNTVTPKLVTFTRMLAENKNAVAILAGAILGALVLAIGAFVATMGPGIAILVGFMTAGAALVTVAKAIVDNWSTVGPILIGIATTLGLIATVLLIEAIPAWWATVTSVAIGAGMMTAALLPILLPFIAIGIAVGVLYAAWTNNWGGIREKTQAVVDWFTTNVLPRIVAFFNAIKAAMKVAIDWFNNTGLPMLVSFFEKALISITNFVSSSRNNFTTWVDDSRGAFTNFVENSRSIFSKWVDDTKVYFTNFGQQAKTTFDALGASVNQQLQPWRQNFTGTLRNTFNEAINLMIDYDLATTAQWQLTWQNWGKSIQTGSLQLLSVWNQFWGVTLPDTLGAQLLNLGAQFQTWAEGLPTQIGNGLLNAGAAYQVWLEGLGSATGTGLLNAGAAFQLWFEGLPDLFRNGLLNAGAAYQETLVNIWNTAIQGWQNAGKKSIEAHTQGNLDMQPTMAGRIVEGILKFIALVLATLVIGFIDCGIRAIIALQKALTDGITGMIKAVQTALQGVFDAIVNMIKGFVPVIKIGLELPDVVGAWNSLKQKAHGIGIPGFATGGIVSGPIGSPQLALVHGGEEITPHTGISSGGGGNGGQVTFNVQVGLFAGSDIELRNISEKIYRSLVTYAGTQNKTVADYLGG